MDKAEFLKNQEALDQTALGPTGGQVPTYAARMQQDIAAQQAATPEQQQQGMQQAAAIGAISTGVAALPAVGGALGALGLGTAGTAAGQAGMFAGNLGIVKLLILNNLLGVFGGEVTEAITGYTQTGEAKATAALAAYALMSDTDVDPVSGRLLKDVFMEEAWKAMFAMGYSEDLKRAYTIKANKERTQNYPTGANQTPDEYVWLIGEDALARDKRYQKEQLDLAETTAGTAAVQAKAQQTIVPAQGVPQGATITKTGYIKPSDYVIPERGPNRLGPPKQPDVVQTPGQGVIQTNQGYERLADGTYRPVSAGGITPPPGSQIVPNPPVPAGPPIKAPEQIEAERVAANEERMRQYDILKSKKRKGLVE